MDGWMNLQEFLFTLYEPISETSDCKPPACFSNSWVNSFLGIQTLETMLANPPIITQYQHSLFSRWLLYLRSFSSHSEKKKSLNVSGIILPPRVIVGQKGRVTVSIEGRRVDRVHTTWFLNDRPISDTSLTGRRSYVHPHDHHHNSLTPTDLGHRTLFWAVVEIAYVASFRLHFRKT